MAQFTYEYVKPIREHYLKAPVIAKDFFKWSKENMYRTSYVDNWQKKPLEPVSMHMPGYGGYVPNVKSENQFGRSYSQISRATLNQPNLGANPNRLSSTGLNYRKFDFLDNSRVANTHKFGAQTMLGTHPCLHVFFFFNLNFLKARHSMSETRASFQNPSKAIPSTYRPTNPFLENPKKITKLSGFASNCKEFDGNGYAPHKVLDAKRNLSEYRLGFNADKPIHRNTKLFCQPKIKKRNVQI